MREHQREPDIIELAKAMDMPKEEVEQAAITHENSAKWMAGKSVKKVIVVPKKIVNIVIG